MAAGLTHAAFFAGKDIVLPEKQVAAD